MALPAPEVQLSIGSRFENIELVKVVLDDCLRRLKADDDVRHWMEMAMREAVANAIKHGNKQDRSEERRVGKESSARWARDESKRKTEGAVRAANEGAE